MNYTLLMELVSQIGCGIAMGGAETYRVEESVNRILGAYGVGYDASQFIYNQF